MNPLIGTRLGPYEIVAAIGAGGMGEVYRARDTRLGREVAIKVLPRALADDPDALSRFDREARAVAAINHPNILALHDIGTDNGIAHAVMELLEGETLGKRLASGLPPPRKALEWAVQIARGLAAAHDRGIVHRDLKPENVFLTRDGRVKILDFGVARRDKTDDDVDRNLTTKTQPGQFVGTPAYASPEQVLGEPATPRSDLFAFGVVLYELLTGTHPFRRETVADTMTAILRADPPPLAGAVHGVPPAALRVIEHCLEKQPSERPSSARDIAMFLDASGNTSVDSFPAVLTDDGPASWRRSQRKVLAVACAVLLAGVATTWGFVRARGEQAVNAALGRDLERAQALVGRVHGWRLERLQLTARLLASFPELKALFDATDAATIRDFLLAYQQQNPGTPLLVAIGPSGIVLGRTDTAETVGTSGSADWSAAVAQHGEPTVLLVSGRPYHAASAAAEAGGKLFGYVVAAVPVDEEFARAISEATGDETVLLSQSALLASTLTGGQAPWKSLEEWRQQGGRSDRATMLALGSRQFAAREVPLTESPPVSAVIAKSRDDALEPFRGIQGGLVAIGLVAVAAALAAGLWLSRAIA
jgi:Protein kinase domain/Double sensory domain of two-component sensor kinase